MAPMMLLRVKEALRYADYIICSMRDIDRDAFTPIDMMLRYAARMRAMRER